jgi:hypothetical protein
MSLFYIISFLHIPLPVPVAARSKAYVFVRSPAEIVDLYPTGGMDVYWGCCVLSGRGLCDGLITRPEGVLPTVARLSVWSRNLEYEESKTRYRAVKIQPHWVVTARKQKQTNKRTYSFTDYFIFIYIFTYFRICFIFTLFYNSCLFSFLYFSLFTSIPVPPSPASCTVQIPCWFTHVPADTTTILLLLLLLPRSFLVIILLPGSLQ